jgi:TRAP-type transport system periplasmic protein
MGASSTNRQQEFRLERRIRARTRPMWQDHPAVKAGALPNSAKARRRPNDPGRMPMNACTRRTLLSSAACAAAMGTFAVLADRSKAAEFEYKIGNDVPDAHPMNVRLEEAIAKIAQESNGRLAFKLFPNNQLGGDTDMLSQLRSGALECFNLSGLILATMIPVASIYGVAFAFKSYNSAFEAVDGELGKHLRGAIEKAGLDCLPRLWNNGYRQIMTGEKPINSPQDLRNMKIRVPVSPLWISFFKAVGAAPAGINWNETYSALQTKTVDGLDTSLLNADISKMYEVQKYCAMTNHMWDGYFFLANRRAWSALPNDLREIAERNFDAACLVQRRDYQKLDADLRPQMEARSITFTDPSPDEFRAALKQAGFYADWHKQYGPKPGRCSKNMRGRWDDGEGPCKSPSCLGKREAPTACYRFDAPSVVRREGAAVKPRELLLAAGACLGAILGQSWSACAEEPSADLLAVQLREQGYRCTNAMKAERDAQLSKPDEAAWVLQCDDGTYRIRLIPDMAAKVEKIR